MIKVHCPQCNVRLTAPDDYVGRPVTCQKCSTKFILSKRWANEPLKSGEREEVKTTDSAADLMLPKPDTQKPGSPEEAAESGLPKSESSHESPKPAVPTATQPTAAMPTAKAASASVAAAVSATTSVQTPAASSAGTTGSPSQEKPAAAIPVGILPSEAIGGEADDDSQAFFPGLAPSDGEASSRRPADSFWLETLDRFDESDSIFDLFDVRFRRFLTPMILRISWVVVLIVFALWTLFVSFVFMMSLLPVAEPGPVDFSPQPVMNDPLEMQVNDSDADEGPHWQLPDWFVDSMSGFLYRSLVYVTTLLKMLLGLLWLRIVFETIIVLFSMAKSLHSMNGRSEQHPE